MVTLFRCLRSKIKIIYTRIKNVGEGDVTHLDSDKDLIKMKGALFSNKSVLHKILQSKKVYLRLFSRQQNRLFSRQQKSIDRIKHYK